ncbi:MAG: Asp23/Gls24 family envelope stress response protein [Firmicutes bacterium]|nr:Asp23/Gls24 family envelope stress response protein [Bacillota bacterium]
MAQQQDTGLGKVQIADEVIASIAGAAATECYGLAGMHARSVPEGISVLLGREDSARGVQVTIDENRAVIDLFVVVQYGVNIAEVARNVMEQVKYAVENQCGLEVAKVNVHVQGVRLDGSPPTASPPAGPRQHRPPTSR